MCFSLFWVVLRSLNTVVEAVIFQACHGRWNIDRREGGAAREAVISQVCHFVCHHLVVLDFSDGLWNNNLRGIFQEKLLWFPH